jgi:multiple antibiotic resistance protein
MPEWVKDFGLSFVQLFVVMDPLAVLPFLVPSLGTVNQHARRRVIRLSLVTGAAVGMAFLGLGKAVFVLLGITVSDFLVAGGLVLLVISLRELVSSKSEEPAAPDELLAVVPIGTPLLVGPATISMLILLTAQYAFWIVLTAFVVNLLAALVVWSQAGLILRVMGHGGLRAFTKVVYLLLAAIAVQLIRQGLSDVLA